MNDLNFFLVDTKKENNRGMKTIIHIASVVLGIWIIGTLGINVFGINRAQNSIENLNSEMSKESFTENYAESQAVANSKKIRTSYNDVLNNIFKSISDRNKVNPDFINEINSTIPAEVSFISMNFSGGILEISASATSRDAIAKFQHNINAVEFIEESHIGGIMSDLGDGDNEVFTFTISCNLKEANPNENK